MNFFSRRTKVKIPTVDEAFLMLAAHDVRDKDEVVADVCKTVPHVFDARVLRVKLDGLIDSQLLVVPESGRMQLTHAGLSSLALLRAQMHLLDVNLAKILR